MLEQFLDGFDGQKGDNNGKITWQEWLDYYTDLSMSLPSDDYFVAMMESVWQILEDEDSTVSKEQIEMLTRTLRQKLLAFSNGSTEELTIRHAFREFDANENGVLSADELTVMLAKLEISVERRYVQSLLRKFDRNGNGVIEFDEFVDFIVHNPYK